MFWLFTLPEVDFLDDADGTFELPLEFADSPFAFGTITRSACRVAGEALEKNPRIERWFLLDDALEFCFFNVGGRAGVSAMASSDFTILADQFGVR